MNPNNDPAATRRMDDMPPPPPADAASGTGSTQEFSISGHDTLEKIKELVSEGNVRRIIVKTREGRTVAEFPLTVGVVGGAALALLAPPLAALGVIMVFAGDLSVIVEKQA